MPDIFWMFVRHSLTYALKEMPLEMPLEVPLEVPLGDCSRYKLSLPIKIAIDRSCLTDTIETKPLKD